MNIELLNSIIKNRRSVHIPQFSDERINDEQVDLLLQNAHEAPTHGLTQPWRFQVFCDEGLNRLATFQAELYKKNAGAEYNEGKYQKLTQNPLKCSHVISIGLNRSNSGKIPMIEDVAAVACAVQNMHLTATALGIGAYWGSGGITYDEEAKSFFGLNIEDKLLGFFYLGIPKGSWPNAPKKNNYKQHVVWNHS